MIVAKLVAVPTIDEISDLQKEFRTILHRYQEVCERSTRLSLAIQDQKGLRKKILEAQLDHLQAGEFFEAEQVYESFVEKVGNFPPEIQTVIYGWDEE
jgi:hypothetical protein